MPTSESPPVSEQKTSPSAEVHINGDATGTPNNTAAAAAAAPAVALSGAVPPPIAVGDIASDDVVNHGGENATSGAQSATPASPLSAEHLALLTLHFDESDFGYLGSIIAPADEEDGNNNSHSKRGAHHHPPAPAQNGAVPKTPGSNIATAFGDFDPYEFVQSKHEHMSLEAIAADLQKLAAVVDRRLLQHIHEDVHGAFTTVAGQLTSLREPLDRLVAPLESSKAQVEAVRAEVEKQYTAAQRAFNGARQHEARRQLHMGLAAVLIAYDAACDAQESLAAYHASMSVVAPNATTPNKGPPGYTVKGAGGAATDGPTAAAVTSPRRSVLSARDAVAHDGALSVFVAQVKRIRRAVADLPPLTLCYGPVPGSAAAVVDAAAEAEPKRKAQDAADVAEAQGLLDAVNAAALQILATALLEAHSSNRPARVEAVIAHYTALGEARELAAAFRDAVVRPVLEGIVSWRAASEARKDPAAAEQTLRAIESALLTVVLPAAEGLRPALKAGATGGSLSVIADVVWSATSDTIQKRLMFLFAPSVADTFRRHYAAAQSILLLMESHCVDAAERALLRGCADTALWQRKWNLDVYVTLQTQAMDGMIRRHYSALQNAASGSPGQTPPSATSGEAAVPPASPAVAFADLREGALWLLGPDVSMPPIAHRAVRAAAGAIVGAVHRQGRAAAAAGVEALLELSGELRALQAWIEGPWAAAAAAALDMAPEVVTTAAASSAAHTAEGAMRTIVSVTAAAVGAVATGAMQQTCTALAAPALALLLKSVSTASVRQYGSASASSPTAASLPSPNPLVTDATDAFASAATSSACRGLPEAVQLELLGAAATDMLAAYKAALIEALKGSLRRLRALQKVRRGGGAAAADAAPALSEFDRLLLQFYADVRAAAGQISAGPLRSPAAAAGLLAPFEPLTRRAEWIVAHQSGSLPAEDASPPALWDDIGE